MNASPRLLEVIDALTETGLKFLVMGGHAVRHYGVDRNTFDFDFHVSANSAEELEIQLSRSRLFDGQKPREGVSWRRADFRRFQIGVLSNGREEWLEFWLRNHLLAPFQELYERHEQVIENGRTLHYLALPDLIRSKETEREDDWSDVRLLEEIFDARNLAVARTSSSSTTVLSQLRSRRGFEMAEAEGLFNDLGQVHQALKLARHPVSCAYLLPFVPEANAPMLDAAVATILRQLKGGTTRHLAVVEAVRAAYQRAAKAADRADKERQLAGQ